MSGVQRAPALLTGEGQLKNSDVGQVDRAAPVQVEAGALPGRIGPRRPGDPACLVADAARARKVLGWTPRRSDLDTVIADAWRWHQKHSG